MKKSTFEDLNEPRWQEMEVLLNHLDRNAAATEMARIPSMFRQVCSDLSLAQHRMYGRRLCDRLNQMVVRCYDMLQRGSGRTGLRFLTFWVRTFPQAVRAEWRLFLVATLLFWLPFGAMIWASHSEPKWMFAMLEPAEMEMMDGSYGHESGQVGTSEDMEVEHQGKFMMFSFYVIHNIGIGLKMFAMGILLCIGTVYVLIWQGLKLGAMFGYVHYTGNADKIWHFAISHSSFELTGIIVCGAAGMRLGLGALLPGRYTRGESIRRAGGKALPMVMGGAGMLFMAAIVEGFWSHSTVSTQARFIFGYGFWAVWALYFLFCGRGRANA